MSPWLTAILFTLFDRFTPGLRKSSGLKYIRFKYLHEELFLKKIHYFRGSPFSQYVNYQHPSIACYQLSFCALYFEQSSNMSSLILFVDQVFTCRSFSFISRQVFEEKKVKITERCFQESRKYQYW